MNHIELVELRNNLYSLEFDESSSKRVRNILQEKGAFIKEKGSIYDIIVINKIELKYYFEFDQCLIASGLEGATTLSNIKKMLENK